MRIRIPGLYIIVVLAGVLTTGSFADESSGNPPSKYDTIDFLEKHFARYANARIVEEDCTYCNKTNNEGVAISSIQYNRRTELMTVLFEFTPDTYYPNLPPPQFGGEFRFDPTTLTGSSCIQWENKYFYLLISSFENGNQIYAVTGNHSNPTGARHNYVKAAFFSDLNQCERAAKAFNYLINFRSEEPF